MSGDAGSGPARVVVVEHDPRWSQLFDREAALLRASLGTDLVALEHVGSTAVPGLAAKPIIDILAGVVRTDEVTTIARHLSDVGYRHDPDSTAPAHIFRKGAGDGGRRSTHNLHVTSVGSNHWRRLVAFRDRLRAHPELAGAYAQLKRDLVADHETDPAAYTAGKHEFVKAVELEAGVEHPTCALCS